MTPQEIFSLTISLFLLIGLSIYIYVFLWFFILKVPFVRSKNAVVEKMTELAKIEKGQKIYDLGCGDGKLLIKASQKGAHCIGIERVYPVYLMGKLRNYWNQTSITFKCKNIFDEDLSNADIIFTYLLTGTMQKLYEEKYKSLKKGTKIISNTFRFAQLQEKKKEKVGNAWVYLYEKEY